MDGTTSDSGSTETCMAVASTFGAMKKNTKVSTLTTKSTVSGCISGPMVAFTKAIGKRASSTDLLNSRRLESLDRKKMCKVAMDSGRQVAD